MEFDCSVNGQQPAGTPLNAATQAYYEGRATLWAALIADLVQHAADGTHQIPVSVQAGFLLVAIPAPPAAAVPLQSCQRY